MYFPYPSFEEAANDVLRHLHQELGFAFWAISRTDEDELELVVTVDSHYGVKDGARVKWSDSICSRMVRGLGPKIAPDLDQVPAYKQAPIAQQVPISAYIGFPLWDSDGQLFGTLAAVDPLPQSEELFRSESTLQLFSRLISTLMSLDMQVRSQSAKSKQLEGVLDNETKLLNPVGWSRFLEAQQRRAKTLGMQSYVASISIENSSAEKIVASVESIRRVLGPNAVLARGSLDQILVCIPEISRDQGDQAMQMLLQELQSYFKNNEVAIQASR